MSDSKRQKQDETWRLASIIEGAQIGTWEWNVQTGETVFNDRWATIVGYTLDELAPVDIKTWERLTHPDDLAKSNRELERHFAGEVPWYDCKVRMRHREGHWVWIHDRGKVITRTTEGAPLMMFGTHLDITASMRAEASLRASEQKYRALFDQSLLGIYLHDLEGRIIDVNDMACAQSGYTREALLERTVFDNFPKTTSNPSREQIVAQWKSWQPGQRLIFAGEHERQDGTVYPVEISTGPVVYDDKTYILAVVQDISERKRTEETLTTIQRLESLGVLAGGIAHDFNNLLSGVFGYLDLAKETTTDPIVADYLDNAVQSINRTRALTQQLLTFSRGGEPVKRVSALFPFIEEAAKFALSGSNVNCDVSSVAPDLWPCEIDRNQISQVIDNVVINAQQAMPNGGSIHISAAPLEIAPPGDGVLSPGRYVKIVLRDEGVGIPKEIVSRIFEPFYTTKSKGHGLGLSTCYSIMKRHHGHIAIASEPGQGTTVSLYLPATESPPDSATADQSTFHSGSGVILVMDDDRVVLETTGQMLKKFGYDMIAVANGEEALDVFSREREDRGTLKAMIFDLTISGGRGGKQTIKEVRNIDTDIPVFVCSGYADDPVMARPREYGFNESLAKPFRLADLARMLNEHLGKR